MDPGVNYKQLSQVKIYRTRERSKLLATQFHAEFNSRCYGCIRYSVQRFACMPALVSYPWS